MRPDRLVPRYPLAPALPAVWVGEAGRRGLLRRPSPAPRHDAEIRDISILGSQIVVAGVLDVARGDRATVECRGTSTTVRVRYATVHEERTFLGVDFVDAAGFLGGLDEFIGRLRGSAADLESWWRRSN